MREIKFRAWADGMMYQNIGVVRNLIILNCEYSEEIGEIHLEPTYYGLHDNSIKLMQYTGLHDKNCKEIYESDIVKITGEQEFDVGHTCRMNDKAVVKWDEKECGYYLDVIKKRTVNFSDFESTSIDTFPLRQWAQEEWWIEYEVVGNVFEGGTE